jgi:transcriptional regulator with PAS, ATPase and Fis domain
VRVGSFWAVEDLGSKNGTFVNGERALRAILGPDDLFELGHTLMRVNLSLAMPSDAPLDLDVCDASADAHATLDPLFAAHLETVAKVAPSDVPVLVVGESGTGKEVLARWLHARTGRHGDFVAVNCGAIPSGLVESQLFGHVKGAFSGAVRDEPGFVRCSDGGTLFLDEIAALPTASQAALLRALQEREVVPVGAARPIQVDVRLVAATHEALDGMVARGEFRRDLYARIAGTILTLPPLRDRRDDIGVLVAALLPALANEQATAMVLARDVGRALLSYDWPMNIRELKQCLATCIALAQGGEVQRWHLPPKVADALEPGLRGEPRKAPGALSERDERLRLELLAQLSEHGGNLTEVGRAMGKARSQVHRWCRRFGVDPNVYRR